MLFQAVLLIIQILCISEFCYLYSPGCHSKQRCLAIKYSKFREPFIFLLFHRWHIVMRSLRSIASFVLTIWNLLLSLYIASFNSSNQYLCIYIWTCTYHSSLPAATTSYRKLCFCSWKARRKWEHILHRHLLWCCYRTKANNLQFYSFNVTTSCL